MELFGYTTAVANPSPNVTMQDLLQVMNKITRHLEPPVEAFVCSRDSWDKIKGEFGRDASGLLSPFMGIEVIVKDTEQEARVAALFLHDKGVRVRLITSKEPECSSSTGQS